MQPNVEPEINTSLYNTGSYSPPQAFVVLVIVSFLPSFLPVPWVFLAILAFLLIAQTKRYTGANTNRMLNLR